MMYLKIKLKNTISIILAAVVIFLMPSCATMGQKVYHGYLMKGNIIEASDSEVYLCIGSKDGALVGQELEVYKIIRVTRARPTFRRVYTGKVEITEIIDEHFAKAKVRKRMTLWN